MVSARRARHEDAKPARPPRRNADQRCAAGLLFLQQAAGNAAVAGFCVQRDVVEEEWAVRRRGQVLSHGRSTTTTEQPPAVPTVRLSGGETLMAPISEDEWAAAEREAAAAAQRRARMETIAAGNPEHYRPVRDQDRTIIGWWFETGVSRRSGEAELRELLDVQGRVVQRNVGAGAVVAEADPLDLVPFVRLARLFRLGPSAVRAARAGAELMERAAQAATVARQSGLVADRLRAALYISVARAEPLLADAAGVRPGARAAVESWSGGARSLQDFLRSLARRSGTYEEAAGMSEARRRYRSWIRDTPNREVAIFVHRPSGRIFVVQGQARTAAEAATVPLTRLGPALGATVADFDVPAHFHPRYAAAVERAHPQASGRLTAMPSLADLRMFARSALEHRRPYRAQIHYLVDAGRGAAFGRTDIVFDATGSSPLITLWVRRGPNRGLRAAFDDHHQLLAALQDLAQGRIPLGALRMDVPVRPPRAP